jgi:tetratricopeptide (TPR) repeat protein
MRYHYDNSAANVRNPNQPPKRVEAGNHATDEMGHLWLQVLPHGGTDRRLELNESLMKHRLDKYPNDYRAHLVLGALLLRRLKPGEALPMAEEAAKIDPKQAEARNLLGSALQAVGRVPEAIVQYKQAIALQPGLVNAHFNLANALMRSRQYDAAVLEYRKVVAAFPNDEIAKERFAIALLGRGRGLVAGDKIEAAEADYRELIGIAPKDATARVEYGDVLLRRGKRAEAIQQYQQAIKLDPSNDAAKIRAGMK